MIYAEDSGTGAPSGTSGDADDIYLLKVGAVRGSVRPDTREIPPICVSIPMLISIDVFYILVCVADTYVQTPVVLWVWLRVLWDGSAFDFQSVKPVYEKKNYHFSP
ncbi:hypothetical protein EVAR_5251_1 [Eumeta japonica]|uniref:Uncharacterized protein n=1 Tax=Eumeta variegata TaxID=151549 RepID=A0A4C1XSB1_EUMVA|nr:hypothetical protein EVAR_5251_1 [Eumeta japonica]